VDLKTLLRTAVKLSEPQWQALKIEVCTDFSQEPLLVRGDSNQLLQVCVQIINDALHAVNQYSSRTLTIAAENTNGLATINISDTSLAGGSGEDQGKDWERDQEKDQEKEEDQTLSSLGLSACQGILRQHQGRILWQQHRNTGTNIRVEIPVIAPAAGKEKSSQAGVPVMWQPQPFA
jgi:C4-dicarboxylate-specific signal transduction histidine kinase